MESKQWPNSTMIASTWYFPDTQSLKVNYRVGSEYKYLNVPPEVWDKLKEATSIGKFINSEIKGKYEFLKLS